MSVTITGYGGVNEIGGNKLLLEDGDTRVFFDFGIAFGRQQDYFNEFLRPRAARGLLDPLALDLIPPLEGLYREDLALPGLWDRFRFRPDYRDMRRVNGPAVDGILLSHAHLDHNGDLSYVDPSYPVLTTRVSAFIARAMQITGLTSFEREMTYTSPRVASPSGELVSDRLSPHIARAHAFVDGALAAGAHTLWEAPPTKTKKLSLAAAEPSTGLLGELPLRWWPVDHSIPGATGFAVETSSGWVGYSGDIRFHGKEGARSWRFAEELAALRPAVLLCEGTHLESDRLTTEAEVVDNALRLVRGATGALVVADFAPRNLERLLSFVEVAQTAGRWLLVQPKDLYMLQAIHLADAAFPDPTTLAGLGAYDDPKAAPRAWEGAVREQWSDAMFGPDEVSANPGDYILAFSLWDANDLLDLQGVAGGVYIFSNSQAYDDEQKADLERLRNWVRHMDFTLYGDPKDTVGIPLHASGHANGPDLLKFVMTVRPQVLVPIHTEQPGWWLDALAGSGITVTAPVMAKAMVF